ncbi:hypothetical protein Tsubulata_038670 [Turnera subulata]|uniref:Uncharacterized protein n=1 Tax=Turnera subulata TaxID=218843 RepID=A0A9Q0FK70_9ROSI|nr:hypothetical protein Tsubulata_038670 [Turnera subulata]
MIALFVLLLYMLICFRIFLSWILMFTVVIIIKRFTQHQLVMKLCSTASLHIDYPMLFELRNPSLERATHCGVLEFVADEGLIYLPYWMMQNMLLQEGDIVQLKNASLGKGTYVKLQPHTKDFLDISNPKAILETSLRNYSCLTTGDTIMVAYNNKQYYIDIVETKPSYAISIIETDCEVDFAPPLDYKEPEKPAASSRSSKRPAEVLKQMDADLHLAVDEEPAKKIPKFCPFTGSAKRLDGKPSSQPKEPASDPTPLPEPSKGINDSKSSSTALRQHSGKLVFGSNVNQSKNETPKVPPKKSSEEKPEKIEEPKFQAFTGKKYSLKG